MRSVRNGPLATHAAEILEADQLGAAVRTVLNGYSSPAGNWSNDGKPEPRFGPPFVPNIVVAGLSVRLEDCAARLEGTRHGSRALWARRTVLMFDWHRCSFHGA